MKNDSKVLINQAINASVASANARKVIRWVLDCELNDLTVINPSNAYFAKKFGWSAGTVRKAVSQAKKSGFVDVIGYGKNRTFELNRKRLQEVVTQFVGRRQHKKPLDLCEIVEKGNTKGNTEGNTLGNTKGNTEGNTKPQNNRGKSHSNNNKKNSVSVNSKKTTRTLDDPKLLKQITVFQSLWSLSLGVAPTILAQLSVVLPPQKLEGYLDFVLDEKNSETIALAMSAAERENRNLDFFLTDNIGRIRNLI